MPYRNFFMLFCVTFFYFGCKERISEKTPETNLPNEGFKLTDKSKTKIALFGDSGIGEGFDKVLDLIKRKNATHIIHLGDLAYIETPSGPKKFNKKINEILSPTFPVLFTIGNHDVSEWLPENTSPKPSYSEILQKRIASSSLNCKAKDDDPKNLGSQSYCLLDNILIVFLGIGTIGDRSTQENYLDHTLTQFANKNWKICVWHKNQKDMQIGRKKDETGFAAYEICQKHGAMIATAHEHSYARSYTLRNIGVRDNSHGKTGEPDKLNLQKGSTFVMINGLGGKSTRPFDCQYHKDDTWWASIVSSNYRKKNEHADFGPFCDGETTESPEPGAVFLSFPDDATKEAVQGEFININDEVLDTFTVTT